MDNIVKWKVRSMSDRTLGNIIEEPRAKVEGDKTLSCERLRVLTPDLRLDPMDSFSMRVIFPLYSTHHSVQAAEQTPASIVDLNVIICKGACWVDVRR